MVPGQGPRILWRQIMWNYMRDFVVWGHWEWAERAKLSQFVHSLVNPSNLIGFSRLRPFLQSSLRIPCLPTHTTWKTSDLLSVEAPRYAVLRLSSCYFFKQYEIDVGSSDLQLLVPIFQFLFIDSVDGCKIFCDFPVFFYRFRWWVWAFYSLWDWLSALFHTATLPWLQLSQLTWWYDNGAWDLWQFFCVGPWFLTTGLRHPGYSCHSWHDGMRMEPETCGNFLCWSMVHDNRNQASQIFIVLFHHRFSVSCCFFCGFLWFFSNFCVQHLGYSTGEILKISKPSGWLTLPHSRSSHGSA